MKSETPARSISATGIWEDARSFRIGCDCQDTSHDVNMWIEIKHDSEVAEVEIGFFVEGSSPWWNKGFSRFRAAWNILVHGHYRSEHHLILDRQGALNLAESIKTTVADLENKINSRKKS